MSDALTTAQAQIHFWPWSVEISAQTMDLMGGNVSFPFFGSPAISLLEGATLLLPSRLERFTPLGPPYQSSTSTCQVYETPHGILAGSTTCKDFETPHVQRKPAHWLHCSRCCREIRIVSGAGQQVYSDIARYILAWSQVFDEMMEKARATWKSLGCGSPGRRFLSNCTIFLKHPTSHGWHSLCRLHSRCTDASRILSPRCAKSCCVNGSLCHCTVFRKLTMHV